MKIERNVNVFKIFLNLVCVYNIKFNLRVGLIFFNFFFWYENVILILEILLIS